MAVTQITYASTINVATTSWSSLAAGAYAASALVVNTTNLYVDAIIGGSVLTGTGVAGDSVQIYAMGNYDIGTATRFGGAIGIAFATGDSVQVVDTDFRAENLILLGSIDTFDSTVTLHFGPYSLASAFGGLMPQNWEIMIHNNGATHGAGGDLTYVGITYTTA